MFPGYEAIRNEPSRSVKVYQPLMEALKDQNIEVVDLANAFDEPVSKEGHYMPGGHFSPHSNRLVAEFLARYLRERQLPNWKRREDRPVREGSASTMRYHGLPMPMMAPTKAFRYRARPFMSVQFHPEAAPGVADTGHLFEEFLRIL